MTQETNYPWDGNITISVNSPGSYSLFLRIPGWSKNASIKHNGKAYTGKVEAGEYVELKGNWTKGDKIQLTLPMPVTLLEANPLVEETRNQVAVKRGPIVYCMESNDVSGKQKITALAIPSKPNFKPVTHTIGNNTIVLLEGTAKLVQQKNWNGQLYREISSEPATDVLVKLVPYFAWGNRGHSEMFVWLPVVRN